MYRIGLPLWLACNGTAPDPVAGNPLGVDESLFPFPSAVYLEEDASTKTGVRVHLDPTHMPKPTDGTIIDPAPWNAADGFSPAMPILVWMGRRVDAKMLVPLTNPELSLEDSSPTVIVDMESGQRVAHFAEVDRLATKEDRQLLMLRPMHLLERARRYAVGIRRALVAEDGSEIPPTAGFGAILDGSEFDDRLERIRGGFDAIFGALSEVGVASSELILAFDLVTASDEQLTRDMAVMQEDSLEWLAKTTLTITVEDVEETPYPETLRIVRGSYTSPRYLEGGPDRQELEVLTLKEGRPQRVGTMDAPFTLVIPARAATERPLPLIQYGHGLLGSPDEAEKDWLRLFAEEYGYVVLAGEWLGLARDDIIAVTETLVNLNRAPVLFDRLKQGIINALVLTRVAREALAGNEMTWVGGEPVIDSSRIYYYGNSFGGIIGAAFLAWSPEITRGVLGVGGGNASLILSRSNEWPPRRLVLSGVLPEAADQQIVLSLIQMLWDPTDGIVGAAMLAPQLVGDVPPRQVLIQSGIADLQVPNVGTNILARTFAMPYLAPVVGDVWGLEPTKGPLSSALTYWDYGYDPPLSNYVMEVDNGVHEAVRRSPASQRQLDQFLKTGIVEQTCDGACDCTTAACD